ncbi:WD40-repeat-containing domain protein [Boletus edulis BED1]|uniref:WD40-repeat-containing domain protein n=1 Tax=Boletus edulis BED1 TaxID=1328754 RepID=A0AAD4BUN1_BOLED|nr:WD40-repeat-containing domain protein [Boletus edulis BED1]
MNAAFSPLSDYQYDREDFSCITTNILDAHTDEVWNIAWSHDGLRLASASKDKTAIIWQMGASLDTASRKGVVEFTLREHPFPVFSLAWSLDDSVLATSADQLILLWDTKTAECIHTLDSHSETVSALVWLPDGSGFVSADLDRKICRWDMAGKLQDDWPGVPLRVTDMAVTLDMSRLVIVGMGYVAVPPTTTTDASQSASQESTPDPSIDRKDAPMQSENRIIVYNVKSKAIELSLPTDGELTSVKISEDSRFALINHAPNEVHLWDLSEGRLTRKFTGQHQGHHVIRSCFGGVGGNLVLSGSEDRNIYVWHRDTGVLAKILSGHGVGSVNAVSWNPCNERMFASCSDDATIRIWDLLAQPAGKIQT